MDSTLSQANLSAMSSKIESLTKASGTEAAKTATKLADSVGSDVLKDLVKELTSDGKLDKADLNILKLFLDVLKSMNEKGQDGAPSPQSSGGGSSGGSTPASGAGGSQSPPSSGGAEGGQKAPEQGGSSPSAGSGGGAEGKKAIEQGGSAPAGQTGGDKSSTSTAGTPPAKSAQETYDDLKKTAMGDGSISDNERTALKNAAQTLGVKDESLEPKDMGQVLKDTLDAAMKDGSISDNEAQAIGSVATAAKGNSKLGAGDIQSMLSNFMKGSESDGNFSDKDLSTFNKLLSLVPGAPSGGAIGSESTAAKSGPTSGGITAAGMANYLFSPFLAQKDVASIVSGLGGAGGVEPEEQKKANESKSA